MGQDAMAGEPAGGGSGAMRSLLFVSLPAVPPDLLPAELARIDAVSRRRNAAAGVTGALICTEWHFAGILEGEAGPVERVMARIRRDPCHQRLVVAEVRPIARRGFAGWKIAYSGSAMYARKLVSPLFDPAEAERAAELRLFLTEMAKQ